MSRYWIKAEWMGRHGSAWCGACEVCRAGGRGRAGINPLHVLEQIIFSLHADLVLLRRRQLALKLGRPLPQLGQRGRHP